MRAIFLIFSLFAAPVAVANDHIHDWFRQFNSLHGTFSQHVIQGNEPAQVSKGELWFVKPFYFRADYRKPAELKLVSDGNTFYNYDVELMQVTTKPAKSLANEGLIAVLSGTSQLVDHYKISTESFDNLSPELQKYTQASNQIFVLTPKDTDGSAVRFVFVLDGATLRVMSAEDDLGVSMMVFDNAKVNTSIDLDLFRFSVPKGVDVLGDLTQPAASNTAAPSQTTENSDLEWKVNTP